MTRCVNDYYYYLDLHNHILFILIVTVACIHLFCFGHNRGAWWGQTKGRESLIVPFVVQMQHFWFLCWELWVGFAFLETQKNGEFLVQEIICGLPFVLDFFQLKNFLLPFYFSLLFFSFLFFCCWLPMRCWRALKTVVSRQVVPFGKIFPPVSFFNCFRRSAISTPSFLLCGIFSLSPFLSTC